MQKTGLYFILLFYVLLCACDNSKNRVSTKDSSENSNDTVISPKGDLVLLLYPNSETIDSLKNKLGDDFYTIADDTNFYNALAYEYLDSLNIPYTTMCDSLPIVFRKEKNADKIVEKNKNLYWYAILYNNKTHSYKVSPIIDLIDDYKLFYNKK